ncbi:MAG: type I-E CRISPR-associated protein Cas6/Cse3/CasE [Dehalococcoidia bacterium]|nr:type I-E CRISPR-associated protein Cas6/Cse3/CasE [Dehalococcoidia bacterium]
MYLSLLKLNPRSRKAMTEATRPYELHRTLIKAFPNAKEGGPGRVLFRLDIDHKGNNISVLVQSQKEPNWSTLTDSGSFLSEQPQHKSFNPTIAVGQMLYFRLRANPTIKREGKRLGILQEEEQIAWLRRKGEKGGFEISSLITIPEGLVNDKMTDKAGSPHKLSLLSVRFEGILKVTNTSIFHQTLKCGIGSGKGLGFGLLSIAPPGKG